MFDKNMYCDFSATASKALAGKDILLAIFNSTGEKLLAIAGQQGLTINRSADTLDVTTKDTKGGWKASLPGMKEWSIDNDGLYVPDDESHKILGTIFEKGDLVCIKVINTKAQTSMFGGLAAITDYSLEAPYDDSMTYSISLNGNGALVDLTNEEPGTMPGEPEFKETYTQEELDAMIKAEIKAIADAKGYTTVNDSDTKDDMITAFLAEQGA